MIPRLRVMRHTVCDDDAEFTGWGITLTWGRFLLELVAARTSCCPLDNPGCSTAKPCTECWEARQW